MATDKPQIKQKIEGASNAMRDFRKEIQELRGKLLQLDESSEDYAQTLSELANKQFILREMNENVRYSVTDLGEQFKTITRIGTSVAAGFNTIQATMALFGTESEALEKTMVKLQAGIAIVQGLEGLEGLGKTLGQAKIQFKGLITPIRSFIASLSAVKSALIATGIGAFVVALGLLVANWDKVAKLWKDTSPEEKAENAINDLNDAFDRQNDIITKENLKALEKYSEKLREAKGNIEAINAAEQEYSDTIRQNALDLANRNLAAAYDAERKVFDLYKSLTDRQRANPENEVVKAFETVKNRVLAAKEEVAKAENDIAKVEADRLADKVKAEQDANAKIVEDRKAAANKAAEDEKAANEALLKEVERIRNESSKVNIDEYTQLTIDYDNDLKVLQDALEKQLITQEQYNTDSENLAKALSNNLSDILDERLKEEQEKYDKSIEDKLYNNATSNNAEILNAEIEAERSLLAVKNGLFRDSNAERMKIIDDFQIFKLNKELEGLNNEQNILTAELENYKGTIEAKIALEERLAEVKYEIAKKEIEIENQKDDPDDPFDKLLGNIQKGAQATVGVLGDVMNAVGEESEAYKSLMIMQGILNAIASSISTYNSVSSIPVVGAWMAPPMAAIALASQLAMVGKMENVDENSASNISTATPNLTSSILPTDIYGSQLSDMTEIDLQEANKDMKVYVLESDITETQNSVKTQVEESHF